MSEAIETFEVDGVEMVFQNTPNTEAPREMNTRIPPMKALWMAENVTATLRNIYTLRGAQVRDPALVEIHNAGALSLRAEAEVMFASRTTGRAGGTSDPGDPARAERIMYAHMNNQVLHLANQGVTINEIHNVYEVPKGLQEKWDCAAITARRSTTRARRDPAVSRLGTANPATLIPLSPGESGAASSR